MATFSRVQVGTVGVCGASSLHLVIRALSVNRSALLKGRDFCVIYIETLHDNLLK